MLGFRSMCLNRIVSEEVISTSSFLLKSPMISGATNKSFSDESPFLTPMTAVGNVRSTSISPFSTENYSPLTEAGSVYLDGTGDYLYSNSSVSVPEGQFTIELWFSPSTTGTVRYLLDNSYWRIGRNGGFRISLNANNTVSLAASSGTYNTFPTILTSSKAVISKSWNHLAITRDENNVIKMYINGKADTSSVVYASSLNLFSSESYLGTTQSLHIGVVIADNTPYNPFNGYISNVRIVSGIAVYTSNFTPSTAPLAAIDGTVLLTCNEKGLTDSSPNNFEITPAGDAKVVSNSPFDIEFLGKSIYFDGSGDYIFTNGAANPIGTANWTLEAFIYVTGTGSSQMVYNYYTTVLDSINIVADGTNKRITGAFRCTGANVNLISSNNSISLNKWHHVVLSRVDSTTVNLYIDGALAVTQPISSSASINNTTMFAGSPSIGAKQNTVGWYFSGYISNLRHVMGTAVYSGNSTTSVNFSVPTGPLEAIPGTYLLTAQNSTITENSANYTYSVYGNTVSSNFTPFEIPAKTLYGSSVYFDGVSDYITIPNSLATYQFGATPFTIEGWFNAEDVNNTQGLLGNFTASSYNGWRIIINAGKISYFQATSIVNRSDTYSNTLLTANTWHHFAVVGDGTTVKLYLDGIEGEVTSSQITNMSGDSTFSIGKNSDNSSGITWLYKGYLSNTRIVRGEALYTSNFTVPSSPLASIKNTTLLLSTDLVGAYDKNRQFPVATVGNVKSSTTIALFDEGSMYFDGSGDYLSMPANSAFGFGTGDFTIECYTYWTGQLPASPANGGMIIDLRAAVAAESTGIFLSTTGLLQYYDGPVNQVYGSTLLPTNAWNHIALTRQSGVWRLFLNGSQVHTHTSSTDLGSTKPVLIGQGQNGTSTSFNGYISNLRLLKGTAAYTSNFTPPQAF